MISVCMATYNGGRYIKAQVESILMQIGENDELIVSDDGSIDDTICIIKSFNDSRIKIYINEGKHGVVPNFENAINRSKGDFIFLSDQDDIWREGKVKACLNALKEVDLVNHNAFVHYSNDKYRDNNYFNIRGSGPGYIKNLWKNTYLGCCMAFRKEVKEYILPFPNNILWHDMWIALMIELKGKTKFIDDLYLEYRRHGKNVSDSSEKSTFSRFFQLKYRLFFLYYTLKRAWFSY